MSNIVAIIVTYNVSSSFSKNVDALLDKVAEIIVVDNGSKQETINMLDSLNGKISLIKLNENKGIAYALNRGIEYALNKSYEWILTLDHDSIVDTNMLTNMLKTYDKMTEVEKEKVVMITPTHVEEKEMSNKIVINSGYEYVLTEITSGALTKAWYYSKNKYDEKLFIDMVDHEFCLEINKNGYKIIRVNSAILLHNLGESERKRIFRLTITPTNHSALRRYYMSRNRMYVWKRYKGKYDEWIKKDKIRFISEFAKIIIFEDDKLNKIKMIKKGISDYKIGKWGAYNK